MIKAAFMGRNGLIHTMPKAGLLNVADLRIFDNVLPALNILGMYGHYILNVITNEKKSQPGGIDYLAIVGHVENWIRNDIYSSIYFRYCYHHHATKCECRLPKTGLIDALQKEHDIDLSESVMFVTSKQELKAAEVAGIGNIIRINTGKADWENSELPLYESLYEAAKELTENG